MLTDNRTKYFAFGAPDLKSCVWTMEKNKEDVYILCRDFPGWKASLRASGKDNIGFISEYYEDHPEIKTQLGSRHFFQADRGEAPLAHLVRIMRLEFISRDGWRAAPNINPIKQRHKNNLKLVSPDTYSGICVIELFYCHDHTNSFHETSMPIENVVAFMDARGGEYYILVASFQQSALESKLFQDKLVLAPSKDSITKSIEMVSLSFGVIKGNRFLIQNLHD